MLQQTRVDVVVPYYERFVARFPTLQALAAAPESDVLAAWSGLGYYSRGRRLHQTAKTIVENHGGLFPATPNAVRRLPGVGDYTAGAILSIAFGQRESAVDGNVRRVIARLIALDADFAKREAQTVVRDLAERLVPSSQPGDFNQALMELGARICTPRGPRCGVCPIQRLCRAFALGAPEEFPRESRTSRSEEWLHVSALIRDAEGRFLLIHRGSDETLLPGLWHFPGIFLPRSEAATAIAQLERHLGKTFGKPPRIGAVAAEASHQITYRKIRALAYEVELPVPAANRKRRRWTSASDLDGLPVSSLLTKLLRSAGKPRQLELPDS